MIVTILNTKGGVGKTTTAMHLAMALHEKEAVEVWDADPQGSATDWSMACEQDGQPLPFAVRPVNIAMMRAAASADKLVFIDTPPSNPDILNAAVGCSQAAIITTKPSKMDTRRMWSTLDNLPSDLPVVVLLTMIRQNTKSFRGAYEAASSEVPVFNTAIRQLEKIGDNANTVPTHLYGYDDVATELRELLETIKK